MVIFSGRLTFKYCVSMLNVVNDHSENLIPVLQLFARKKLKNKNNNKHDIIRSVDLGWCLET